MGLAGEVRPGYGFRDSLVCRLSGFRAARLRFGAIAWRQAWNGGAGGGVRKGGPERQTRFPEFREEPIFDHLSALVFPTNERITPQAPGWPLPWSCFGPVLCHRKQRRTSLKLRRRFGAASVAGACFRDGSVPGIGNWPALSA